MASVFDCTALSGTSDKTVLKKNFLKLKVRGNVQVPLLNNQTPAHQPRIKGI